MSIVGSSEVAAAVGEATVGESHIDDVVTTDTPSPSLIDTYNPEMISRYVHFYKTGLDINDPINDTSAPNSTNTIVQQPPNKKQRLSKKKKTPPAVLQTRRTIQLCCRDNNLPLALQTFHNALTNLIKIEPQTFYQLLNLCEGGVERSSVHVGTPKVAKHKDEEGDKQTMTVAADIPKVSLAQRQHHATQIHSLLSSLSMPLTEQAYTAIIRLSTRAGNYEQAEGYLDEAEGTQQCKVKLRMYSSLLRGYCGEKLGGVDDDEENVEKNGKQDGGAVKVTQENLIKALKVWKRMYDNSGGLSTGHPNYKSNASKQQQKDNVDTANLFGEGILPKIQLTELEYTSLMKCATKLHDVRVMERILSDVADEILIPGVKCTEMILNWFRSDNVASADVSSALDQVTLPPRADPTLGCVTNFNGKGWRIYRSCKVDTSSGRLTLGKPECQAECKEDEHNSNKAQYHLKPVDLSNRAWSEMRDMNSKIVLEGQVEGHLSQFQGGKKGKKRPRSGNKSSSSSSSNGKRSSDSKSQRRINAWQQFESFLQGHPPYSIVIDGANVGYYQQNFSDAKHVDYKQIDSLLKHLFEKQDSKQRQHIILFLHERHFSSNLAPSWANELIRKWDGNESPYDRLTVYRTPGGCDDDWFWMHAALFNGGKDVNGEKSAEQSVLAITNDEMRDHHFQMLAQGSFLRWKERHQVHFDFGAWNGELRRRDALLHYPNTYSRHIQRVMGNAGQEGEGGSEAFVIPLPKKGDEGRFADGMHVAEGCVPNEETYIVIERVL